MSEAESRGENHWKPPVGKSKTQDNNDGMVTFKKTCKAGGNAAPSYIVTDRHTVLGCCDKGTVGQPPVLQRQQKCQRCCCKWLCHGNLAMKMTVVLAAAATAAAVATVQQRGGAATAVAVLASGTLLRTNAPRR